MTIKEAMRLRHTVRRFTDKPIPAETAALLQTRIEENNRAYGLDMALVTDSDDGMGFLARVIGKGVNNYLILAADSADKEEWLGYCGTDVILYAQSLGINSWWIGGMFDRKGAEKHLNTHGAKINSVIALGYGQTQGTPHRAKTAQQISQYDGTAPQWFRDGVEAVLLAPTAINRMAYTIKGSGDQVSMTYAPGPFSAVDLGIGRYHFEVGAGKENFRWVER